jgi:rhodanese-related sulfurtransferase
MTRLVLLVFVVVGLAAPQVLACDGCKAPSTSGKQLLKMDLQAPTVVTAGDLKALLDLAKEKKALDRVRVFDANTDETREVWGTVPGAELLSGAESYSVSKLPTDKTTKLIFYCYNKRCSASKVAARRAQLAGYPDVSVVSEGIVGWSKAGLPTVKSPRS